MLGTSAQEMVLTYAGDGESCKAARARRANCPRCCTNVIKTSGPNMGDSTSCDEFPFRSTTEGGSGAWISCVAAWENTMQGIYINSWNADHGIAAGDHFLVRVTNLDCSSVQQSDLQGCGGVIRKAKRDEEVILPLSERDTTPQQSGTENTLRQAFDNSSQYVVVPFSDYANGASFSVSAQSTGHGASIFTNVTVVDSVGTVWAEAASLTDLESAGILLDFTTDDYVGGLGLVGVVPENTTAAANVDLTWGLDVNASLPSPTPKNDGSGLRSSCPSLASRLFISLVAYMFI